MGKACRSQGFFPPVPFAACQLACSLSSLAGPGHTNQQCSVISVEWSLVPGCENRDASATIWTNLETCPMPTFIRSENKKYIPFGDPESILLRATAYFLQLWNGISSVNPSSGFIVSSVAGSFGPTRQKGSRWQFPAGHGRSVSFWPPKVVVKERVYMDW